MSHYIIVCNEQFDTEDDAWERIHEMDIDDIDMDPWGLHQSSPKMDFDVMEVEFDGLYDGL